MGLLDEVYARIFAPRAVDRGIAESRPYVAYPRDGRHIVFAADPKYRLEMDDREKWIVRSAVVQGPGIVIVKEPFPGEDPVFAQIRPDETLRWPGPLHDHEKYTRSGSHGLRKHLLKHAGDTEHDGVAGLGDRHRHERTAKYFMPPGAGRAVRFDVHPRSDVKSSGGVGFLALEGSIKADAILSAGFDHVLAVPSVTCWRAPELPRIAEWAAGLEGFAIASDSDWYTNTAVIKQSRKARDAFRDAGVNAMHVSPPHPRRGPKIGIDDFLAAGGQIGGLLVVELKLPLGWEEAIPGTRPDVRDRNRRVLQEIILHATPMGYYEGTERGISEELGASVRIGAKAIADFKKIGALKEVTKATKHLEAGTWVNTPTTWFLLDRRLRPIPVTTRLGDAFPQVDGAR